MTEKSLCLQCVLLPDCCTQEAPEGQGRDVIARWIRVSDRCELRGGQPTLPGRRLHARTYHRRRFAAARVATLRRRLQRVAGHTQYVYNTTSVVGVRVYTFLTDMSKKTLKTPSKSLVLTIGQFSVASLRGRQIEYQP